MAATCALRARSGRRWSPGSRMSRALGAEVSVLLVGHSRGGAIANLVAAELDDLGARAGDAAPFGPVYAYTFAAPATTLASDARSERYSNIFNIANPSDIMPYLPLSASGDTSVTASISSFRVLAVRILIASRTRCAPCIARSVGVECSADAADVLIARTVCDNIAAAVGSARRTALPLLARSRHSDCWQRTSIRADPSTAIIPARTSHRGCPSPTSLNWGQAQIENMPIGAGVLGRFRASP